MRTAPILGALLALALHAAPPRPPLVVVISVDQFSAELASRRSRDLPGGLGRLWREGTVFTNAWQDHGYTETGPGHSVILTGRHPMHTGITENTWLDRSQGKATYCVRDDGAPLVEGKGPGASPASLAGTTLGEWMAASLEDSRSFAVAGKDRAAVLMAGHRARGVYWFVAGTGFTTSRAYAQQLPAWLQTHNAGLMAGLQARPLVWEPAPGRPALPSETWTVAGKRVDLGLPRVLRAAEAPLDPAFWDRFRASPYFDEAILGTARVLLREERLGRGPGTDLLAVSLSATDYIGHRFGNAGPEMEDQLVRLDRSLGIFLEALREDVPDAWVILTADHGGRDFPERMAARGVPAQRFHADAWARTFNQELQRRLGGARPWFLPSSGQQLYLDPLALAQSGRARAEVLQEAVRLARSLPEVEGAFTADELALERPDPAQAPADRSLKARIALSFVPTRSGDLLLAFKAPYVIHDPGHLAEHGSPQDPDRRVPLLFYGPWRPGIRTEPVRIIDLAPTVAQELGIAPLEPVDGRPLRLDAK
ncbi:alkaline phosphatase family protein [Mesoterricola sediminis]|uniref:Alkaline phosphatase n=1 Tax=Mesoterricola sediminis TaxID=2927980 RepID=A0AA48H467_9BACT|nr:alkaline phosphatase family protein [Mesoterricola sediminis]BDU77146.1 alkaline phosphatase [Mesoterricola sediminis]